MTLCELSLALPGRLLPWYGSHARDLPWRQDRQPYHILLSEIMLQQTRVEAVRAYYLRFLDRLPTIEALAEADEQTLLKLWEGLGYYSRVRNLQMAARAIVAAGGFPTSREGLLALPGVGAYTAGAVGSICFDLPTPAVDGNVLRVMTRLAAIDTPITSAALRREITAALAAAYPAGRCSTFTQALMELGATVCGPGGAPACALCPVADLCACADGRWKDIPVRPAKKARRREEYTVLILRCGETIALQKRPDTGLLAGLWELPNRPGRLDAQGAMDWAVSLGVQPQRLLRQLTRRHIFTHVEWQLHGYEFLCGQAAPPLQWQPACEAALPTAFRILLDRDDD